VSSTPVAWTAIEPNTAVVGAGGIQVGRIVQVAGDENADIFDGLVVTASGLEGKRYIPAERVKSIWVDRVETDLSADEATHLETWSEPPTTTVWHADEGGGFGARMRRAWNALLGRRG
jgi:hypothetical protein